MRYAVTDVTIYGATTVEYANIVAAEAAFALRRADPMTLYVQSVVDGRITQQYTKMVARRQAVVYAMHQEGNTVRDSDT